MHVCSQKVIKDHNFFGQKMVYYDIWHMAMFACLTTGITTGITIGITIGITTMDIRSNGSPRNWAGAVGPQLSPADNLFIFLTLSQQEADSLFIFLAFS